MKCNILKQRQKSHNAKQNIYFGHDMTSAAPRGEQEIPIKIKSMKKVTRVGSPSPMLNLKSPQHRHTHGGGAGM